MKQIKLFLMALFTLCAANVFAEGNITVAGVQVTNENANDVLGDGTVRFVEEEYQCVLTLNGANFANTPSTDEAIYSSLTKTLTIKIEGENTITSEYMGITCDNFLNISGSGSLKIIAGENGIFARGGLQIGDIALEINMEDTGVAAIDCENTNLTFYAPSVKINNAQGVPAIKKAASITLDYCEITSPEGAAYDAALKGVAVGGSLVENLEIKPLPATVSVKNILVTPANASDILEDGGKVSYNFETKTLTLNNVTIEGEYTKGIEVNRFWSKQQDDITIELIGTNAINMPTSGFNPLSLQNINATIQGDGNLTISSTGDGIWMNSSRLEIKNTAISVSAKWAGVNAVKKSELVFNNSFGTIAGEQRAVSEETAVSYVFCKVVDVEQNGGIVTKITFNPNVETYNLYVFNTLVTDLNAADILGDNKVSYDPTTKTLTLNNVVADLTEDGKQIIDGDIEDLIINLEGENDITSDLGITLYKSTTIKGTGSLKMKVNNDSGISFENGILTIDNTTIEAYASEEAILGGTSTKLIIKNSSVKAESENSNTIVGMNELELQDCEITSPEGAAFDAELKGIANDGVLLYSKITIEPKVPEIYDLYVLDTRVTELNAADVLGDGKVTYDPATKTLTLNNVKLESLVEENRNVIDSEIDELTINLEGKNEIYTNEYSGIKSLSHFTLTGTGSLYIQSNSYYAIYTEDEGMSIENTTLEVIGYYGGIFCENHELTIINSSVKATSETDGAIAGISNLILQDCEITSPEGAAFDAALNGIAKDGVLAGVVEIKPNKEPTIYDLWIADTQVTEANAADVLGDGKVTYDPATKTLTLNNVKLESLVEENRNVIDSDIDELTINLEGKNEIYTNEYSGIKSLSHFTLTGTGSLYIQSNSYYAIYTEDEGMSIENTTLEVIGYYGGIFCENHELTIINSSVKATGETDGAIAGISNLILQDCEITSPEGAAFDAALNGIAKDGVLAGVVEIKPNKEPTVYDLWIADTQVTEANAADVLGDGGTVSYNFETKTLTLDNATIISEGTGIYCDEMEELNIVLKGKNTIKCTPYRQSIVMMYGGSIVPELTISGKGSLNIEECVVGITAIGKLTIKQTQITIKSEMAALGTMGKITLQDCAITEPKNTIIDTYLTGEGLFYTALLEGEPVKELVISATPTALETVEADADIFAHNGRIFNVENARIYDILGRDVTRMNGNLQGVYVVKTEKTATKIIVR